MSACLTNDAPLQSHERMSLNPNIRTGSSSSAFSYSTSSHARSIVGVTAAIFVALIPATARAEIQTFEMRLNPDSRVIHYVKAIIRGPGSVDLSHLDFTAMSQPVEGNDDSVLMFEGEDDKYEVDDKVDSPYEDAEEEVDDISNDNPRDRRYLLDGEGSDDYSTVDVAVLHLPDDCANTREGCTWTDQGLGFVRDDGLKQWCCTYEYKREDRCGEEGRLIMDATVFSGEHRSIRIAAEGSVVESINAHFTLEDSGKYALILANCNDHGRVIEVTGTTAWKSDHGYLPGQLFGFMYFYAGVLAIYILLLAWYGVSMHLYQDSRIPIEKWIFMTIVLGLLEMFFRTGDFFVWNEDGYRQYFIGYVGLIAGVLKQGISRCLLIMVSLGWGVIRDSLGRTLHPIVLLGTVYCCANAARDLMMVFAIEDVQTLSDKQETNLFDVVQDLAIVVALVDVIFIFWILDALNNTMEYLDTNKQTRKLVRFLRLRTLFLFSTLFATIWVVFALVDTYDETGIVAQEHEWVVEATTEVNYLFVLIGVACLWKPNPNAKEYAYVMELPALETGEEGETVLEMAGVVPSAMDDDEPDEDEDHKGDANGTAASGNKNGAFRDEPARFEID